MIVFACVLRSGGIYDETYVRRLTAGAVRHIRGVDRVICLSDLRLDIPGVEVVPLKHGWPGWWSKMELFRPDVVPGFEDGAFLVYSDLDNVFMRDASLLSELEGPVFLEELTHPGRLSSALMAFAEGSLTRVYSRFAQDPERWMAPGSCGGVPNTVHGDQVVIEHFLREAGIGFDFFQDFDPGIAERYHPYRHDTAPVVCFMGPSKPHKALPGIVRKTWESYGT